MNVATSSTVSTFGQVLKMSTYDSLKNYFGKELKRKRKSLNISQEEMSERLGVSLRSYSDLENSKNFCSAISLICYVINCDVDKDELFSDFAEIMKDDDFLF